MAETVQIVLNANAAPVVAALTQVNTAATKLNATVGFATRQALMQVNQAAGAAATAMTEFATAIGIGAGAMVGALAIGAGMKRAIEEWTSTINITTAGIVTLGDQADSTGKKLKRMAEESRKVGLIDDNEELGFLMSIAQAQSLSQDPDAAASAMSKVTREMRELLDKRRELRAIERAQDAANLSTMKNYSMLGQARAGLEEAQLGSSVMDPEVEGSIRLATLRELHKRRLNEFTFEEIQAEKAVAEAKRGTDAALIISREADLETLRKKREASELDLAAKELQIQKKTSDERAKIDAEARLQRQGTYDFEDLELLRSPDNSFGTKLAATLGETVGYFTDFSSRAAEAITGGVMAAVDGLAESITGLIDGTREWADVWRSVTSNILGMIMQLIIRFTVLSGVMALLGILFPGSAFVGKLANFAGVGGRASGGIVGSGLYQVGEQGPEYVVNSPTLNRLGSGFFDALQSGYRPGAAAPAAGPSGAGKVHIGFVNGPGQMADWLQSTDGRRVIVDIMSQEIHEFRG